MILKTSRFFNAIHEPLFEALLQGFDGCLVLFLVELSILILVEEFGYEIISIIDDSITIKVVTNVRYSSLLALCHHNRFGPPLAALCALARCTHVYHGGPPVRHLYRDQLRILTDLLFQDVAIIGLTWVNCLLDWHSCDIVTKGMVTSWVKLL